MSSPSPNHGIICALWTPLDASGEIDLDLLNRHLDFLLGAGIAGIMALGSTGRFPNLDVETRERLLIHILDRAGDLPVVANISDMDLRVVQRLGDVARDHGAAGVSVLPPWYYELPQSDLIEWFVAAGRSARVPLWLYNFPERTGNQIELNTVKEVIGRVSVAGFKQSGANQEFMSELARLAETTPFAIFAGADDQIAESLKLGAVGCISGLANALPDVMVRVYEAVKAGRAQDVARYQDLLTGVVRRFHLIPFPWNQGAIMEARGIGAGALPEVMSRVSRAHFEQLTKETRDMIEACRVSRLS